MRQNGIVKDIDGDMALVALSGADGCASCSGKSGCGIFCSSGEGRKEAWVSNPAGAARGDRVEVELTPSASLLLAGSLFVLPVVVLVISLALLPAGAAPMRTAIHAAGGAVLGITAGIVTSKLMAKTKNFDLKIVAILDGGGSS